MEEGDSQQILKHPKHPYTQALVQSLPKFGNHYTKSKMIFIPGRVTDAANPEPGCPFEPRCQFSKQECKIPNCDCWKIEEK